MVAGLSVVVEFPPSSCHKVLPGFDNVDDAGDDDDFGDDTEYDDEVGAVNGKINYKLQATLLMMIVKLHPCMMVGQPVVPTLVHSRCDPGQDGRNSERCKKFDDVWPLLYYDADADADADADTDADAVSDWVF